MSRYFFLVVFCSMLYSCKDEYTICNESKYSVLNAGIFKRTSAGDSLLKAPGLTVTDLASNKLILNQAADVSVLNLPLVPGVDSAKFAIQFSPTAARDTVTVKYSSSQDYLSLECGYIDVYAITNFTFTRHRLDTARVVDPAVKNKSLTNVKLYY